MVHKVLCVVMDGVGLRDSQFGNAVALANAPTLARLKDSHLFTTLAAHGTAVGLPSDDDIGNSEVGHNALGAGRVFAQGAKLVQIAIGDGTIYQGACWKKLVESLKASNGTLHLMGLLSDGNVHAHQDHLHALLTRAKAEGLKKARVHVLFDGRDVGEKSAEIYVQRLESTMASLRSPTCDVRVASGGGRMHITMDRYNADWGMVKRGWETHVHGKARHQFPSLPGALAQFRLDPTLTDQYLPEFVITENNAPVGKIVDGDAVVFYNFRGDRAIEISKAFTDDEFPYFDRGQRPQVFYAGMMEYDGDLHIPPHYLVSPPQIDHTLSQYLAGLGLRQFACSETQKFGHVTYFWNGNRSGYVAPALEEYVEIPSDSDVTFDLRPEMKAKEIADVTIDRMKKQSFDFGRINFANGDMVGHMGHLAPAIKAVEAVDVQLARLFKAADETGYTLIITADHGNADEMYDAKEKDFPEWQKPGTKLPRPKTSHTLAPVPFAIYGKRAQDFQLAGVERRTLANVASTVLALMDVKPEALYLPSLITRKS